jgi:hypothetical protein
LPEFRSVFVLDLWMVIVVLFAMVVIVVFFIVIVMVVVVVVIVVVMRLTRADLRPFFVFAFSNRVLLFDPVDHLVEPLQKRSARFLIPAIDTELWLNFAS